MIISLFYKVFKTCIFKIYFFVLRILFLQKNSVMSRDFSHVESRPMYSFLDIFISDEFLVIIKSGFHLDSLIKRVFVSVLQKINAFSVIVLENFLIQHFFKKTIQLLWNASAFLYSKRRDFTTVFIFFWYFSTFLAIFYFFV